MNYKFQHNAEFFFDYYVDDPPAVPQDIVERITVIVRAELGITYFQLTSKHGMNPDHINMLIANNELYVDLDKELVADTKETHIYIDEESAKSHIVVARGKSPYLRDHHTIDIEIGKKIKWNEQEWTIAAHGDQYITLYADNGTVIKPLITAFEDLVRTGEIIGLNKSAMKSEIDTKYNEFYRRATKKDWKLLQRRQIFISMLKSQKGGNSSEQNNTKH